eukprot:SAG31_NODE_14811_length_786_cov_1.350801_1_plen_106_part_00
MQKEGADQNAAGATGSVGESGGFRQLHPARTMQPPASNNPGPPPLGDQPISQQPLPLQHNQPPPSQQQLTLNPQQQQQYTDMLSNTVSANIDAMMNNFDQVVASM